MAGSEDDRIAVLRRVFGERGDRVLTGIGDDASVVRPGGAVIVTSVDAVVDGVHFTREHFPPRAIGRKAAASALSDLAAMGAAAGEIYIAAGVPQDLPDEDFEQIAIGIQEVAATAGATAIGGDLSAAGELWLSVTVVGYAQQESDVIARDGAQPGDIVAVTGDFGGSAAGLALLTKTSTAGDPATTDELEARQLHPTPRFNAGRALAAAGASAMIDVSDGIARDATQIATASNRDLQIELAKIPLADGVEAIARTLGKDPQVYAAESGEEYELLCTLPPDRFDAAAAATAATGSTLTAIGRVTENPGAGARFSAGDGRPVEVAGYQHFN